MQDPTQNNTDEKQYFDIKGPSQADPTSRPVINNAPVQSDPMVSAKSATVVDLDSVNQQTEAEEAQSVNDEINSILAQPDTEANETIPINAQLGNSDVTQDVASDPIALEGAPEAQVAPIVYQVSTNQDNSDDSQTAPLDSTGTTVNDPSINTENLAETETVEAVAPITEVNPSMDAPEPTPVIPDTPVQPTSDFSTTQTKINESDHKKSGFLKENMVLKIVAAFLLVTLLVLGVVLYQKYKSGQ